MKTSTLTKTQYKHYGPKPIQGYGKGAAIWATVRYDDECGNGHNSFSVTAQVRVPGMRDIAAGGCMHEEIAKAFPELAPFIKWHLCSSDGPMHYIANTVYFAGDRDHNGKRTGEPYRFDRVLKFACSPIEWKGGSNFIKWCDELGAEKVSDCEVLPVEHPADTQSNYKFSPKFTLGGFDARWHECPFDTEREALQFLKAAKQGFEMMRVPTAWSEGKQRALNAAREAAIWPEATDAELSQEPEELKSALLARLPVLLNEFQTAVESLGFVY